MAMWHVMFGMGLGLFVCVGVTIMSMMTAQRLQAIPRPKIITYNSTPDDNCPICRDSMTNEEMKYLKCGHALHDRCFRELRRHGDNKCPTCREIYT